MNAASAYGAVLRQSHGVSEHTLVQLQSGQTNAGVFELAFASILDIGQVL
jgi:hypothetical protein